MIEEDWIQRPKFEDGTSLQNGDVVEIDGKDHVVYSYLVSSEPRMGVPYGNRYASLHLSGGRTVNVDLDNPLKRPKKKVFDADGNEIHVGDYVYPLTGELKGEKCKVISFDIVTSRLSCMEIAFITVEGNYTFHANNVSVKKPIFDADGERIKVGDTLWFPEDGNNPYTVLEITDNDKVKVEGWQRDLFTFTPTRFTHVEPDSLEKLRDDMLKWDERGIYPVSMGELASRVQGLIDRSV